MTNVPTNEDIYNATHKELRDCWLVTGANKHNPDSRLETLKLSSLIGLLAKIDRRSNRSNTKGGRGLIFPLETCQRIMDDPNNSDVHDLRESIAKAIVQHRIEALGVDETATIDGMSFDDDYDEDDDEESNGSVDRENDRGRASGSYNRSRSRSPVGCDEQKKQQQKKQQKKQPQERQDQDRQQEQRPRGMDTIEAVTKAAYAALMSPNRLKIYNAAMSVLTGDGLFDKQVHADPEQRSKSWMALCPPARQCQSPPWRKLINAASGVLMGDPCEPEAALSQDMAILKAAVDRVLSGGPDRHRACLALSIIRRSTLLPKATLMTVLQCGDQKEVGTKMLQVSSTLFSWAMRWSPDGSERAPPEPWVADVCKTAMRILHDMPVK